MKTAEIEALIKQKWEEIRELRSQAIALEEKRRKGQADTTQIEDAIAKKHGELSELDRQREKSFRVRVF